MLTYEDIQQWIREKNGILTTKSALVHRESYFGNDVIAKNSSAAPGIADHRGYVPVEQWIMSTVEADNPIRKAGEGITVIPIHGIMVPLTDLRDIGSQLIFGDYAPRWPLAKILDIGGKPVTTSFGTTETPPIPVHVHGGAIRDGIVHKPGKSEAYFFPPTDIPPHHTTTSAITRIGLKPGVTKEHIKEKLPAFGIDDSMYTLLNEFPITPMTGWTVPEGVLHAPGPHVTFEIQLPQDDYNMASWRLGERLDTKEQSQKYQEHVLRGLPDEYTLVASVLDWPVTSDQDLHKKYFHEPQVIASGPWGRRLRIFFDRFYGEGWEVLPEHTMELAAKAVPQAGIAWSGSGKINGNPISQSGTNEFLCIPNTPIVVSNPGPHTLYIYTVEPIRD